MKTNLEREGERERERYGKAVVIYLSSIRENY